MMIPAAMRKKMIGIIGAGDRERARLCYHDMCYKRLAVIILARWRLPV